MLTIVDMVFGSHLYGTASENSDKDFKGVFVPTIDSMLLGNAPKSVNRSTKKASDRKNDPSDVDSEMYSLHYFLHLAKMGETVALDMLHAPASACMVSHPIWEDLCSNRHRFYTKNLKALVGYARKQAAKYGIKGSRLAQAKVVLEFLGSQEPHIRLIDVWDKLPEGEHVHKLQTDTDHIYEVCGKKMVASARCQYYVEMMQKFSDRYGGRARLAEVNEGIDWKAISHAFRAAYQVRHILVDGGFSYPMPETPYILAVKRGGINYADAGPALDQLIEEVEALSESSAYPEHVNEVWVNDWLLSVLHNLSPKTITKASNDRPPQ